MPVVTDLKSQEAQDKLFAAGFQPTVAEVASTDPVGVVASQKPAAGEVAETGSRVTINVSTGPGTVAVPATIGQTVSEATTTVQDAGLVVYVKPVSSSKNIGQVVAQTPAAGAQADTGSTVQINVSRGTGQVAVPKLVGLLSGPAQAQLTQLGLEPNVVSVPSSEPKGTVVAQNPNPGVQLAIGATVRMNVSSG